MIQLLKSMLGLLGVMCVVSCSQPGSIVATRDVSSILDSQEVLRTIQPALAVRGMGCVSCHAQINSNVITDFGLDGDSKGRNYFFGNFNSAGNIRWNSGSIYGDHAESFRTIKLENQKSIIVPAAKTPDNVAVNKSIASYVQGQLPTSKVVEASHVYIGSPGAERLKQIFNWTPSSQSIIYRKDTASSANFSGIVLAQNGKYFENKDVVTCEGDVLINGTLHLENLSLLSRNGCRIYVTESVFIYGPINYLNKDLPAYSLQNLQIVSARSINLGLGNVKKAGVNCDGPEGWYSKTVPDETSSLTYRYQRLWTLPGHFTRESKTPEQLGQDVLADANKIDKQLLDATCRTETRNVSFERLLLNAPQVQSRYQGDFRGTIVAEIALISLGQFKFYFDPVFLSVNTLPLLGPDEILRVDQ